MLVNKLSGEPYIIIEQLEIANKPLIVKEASCYRWFEYGGDSVQSVMNKNSPEYLVSPISQSLLIFLLFNNNKLNILNLGLGGGSVERALAVMHRVSITTVESSISIIEMAKRHFFLPENINLHCQKAEHFIEQTDSKYDVVICDLFVGDKNPSSVFSEGFYSHLARITTDKAVLMLNLQVDSEQQLLTLLISIKTYFPFLAIIEFSDYSNIVIVCSCYELPNRKTLQERLGNFAEINFTSLQKLIENMHFIPTIN